MPVKDISRSAFDVRKQYSGVRMQQGRVMLDDDYNDNERIESEDRRRSRVEIIGPAGSPDNGFRIANPRLNTAGQVDFDIEPGAFYLGGLRLELFASQTFRAQTDYVDFPPALGAAPAGNRSDLVLLLAYEEPISGVEDAELLEAALGGPDTSARMRLHQRVLLVEDIGAAECDLAWQRLRERWARLGLGQVNDEHELVSDASLRVTFVPGGDPSDLCTPFAAGGYLGAENQAIRVQLVDADHFTWGFDNAAPLYRVQAAADRQTLTLLTDPRDQAHWPLAGQVVEVLPWAAVLPNREKLSANRGHLARVETSYNPDTRELRLLTPIPTAGFDDWTSRPDAADLAAGGAYFFLRVWNRGTDRASDPGIAFVPGTPVTLGQTGVQVTIAGANRVADDYWILAARPETPDRIVPWDFAAGRRPHGVRRFVTPLALIQWTVANGQVVAEVDDCRDTFPPLTRLRTCCTYTVGDGVTSHGHFNSIEEALRHLPAAGGELCLLPGFHEANAVIERRRNIKISGCERRSRVSPRAGNRQAPIFTVRDSAGIILENMDLVTLEGSAIVVEGSRPGRVREVEVRGNRMMAYRNALQVRQGAAINLHHNLIRMLDREGGDVAIFILAEDGRIERNDIGVQPFRERPPVDDTPPPRDGEEPPDPADPCADFEKLYRNRAYLLAYTRFAWSAARPLRLAPFAVAQPFRTLGGIQVGSGSERIDIVENIIHGGAGNGITLGSDLEAADLPQGEPPPEQAAPRLANRQDQIAGVVAFENQPVKGLTLVLLAADGKRLTAVTDERGFFRLVAPPGEYQVLASHPEYRAARVLSPTSDVMSVAVFQRLHRIDLERVERAPDVQDALAFIYDVRIDGNEIADMGLNGIGAPLLDREQLAALLRTATIHTNRSDLVLLAALAQFFGVQTGIVVGLVIQENHITGCLRNSFDEALRAVVLRRGLGGLSLGLCEDLVIRENRIVENGPGHVVPVCGIYLAYGEQVQISHNQVLDNGPVNLSDERQLLPGLRSGIFVRLASARALSDLLSGRGAAVRATVANLRRVSEAAVAEAPSAARYAARLHANVVAQPVGRALSLLAFGAVAVTDNRFNTDFAGQDNLDRLAGAVGILNLGRSPLLDQATMRTTAFTTGATLGAGAALGAAALAARRSSHLPDGNLQFNDNQTLLARAGGSLIAQTIMTLDDLVFDANQSDVLDAPALRINTLLLSPTVRASGNRLKEPFGGRRNGNGQ